MLTYHRAFIRLCAVILAITITPYCCWEVISTVVASQSDTMSTPVTNNISTTKTDGTSVIAPLPDGSLVEINYLSTDIEQLIAPFESYADLQIEECLLDQTAGATLMYDGTLMYTEYCRDLYNTHQQLRQAIAE